MSIAQPTKCCTQCQETLSVAEFHKSRTLKSGLQSKCKNCVKRYSHSVAGKAANKKYRSSELGRAAYRRKSKKYRRHHPDQVKAQNVINNLVVAEILPPARTLECTHCGAQAKEYHHNLGYAREHRLDVIPLCKQCHVGAI